MSEHGAVAPAAGRPWCQARASEQPSCSRAHAEPASRAVSASGEKCLRPTFPARSPLARPWPLPTAARRHPGAEGSVLTGKLLPVVYCAPCTSPNSVGFPTCRQQGPPRCGPRSVQAAASPSAGLGGTPACAPRGRAPRQRGATARRWGGAAAAAPPSCACAQDWGQTRGQGRGTGRGMGAAHTLRADPPTRPSSGLLGDSSPVVLLTRLPGAPSEYPRPAGGSQSPL